MKPVVYTLDTNALIYYLKDEPSAALHIQEVLLKQSRVFISAISEIEILAFPNISPEEIQNIKNLLTILTVVPVDSRIAQLAGYLRRTYRMKLPDSAIAATALATRSHLMTRNTKDFRRIPKLELIKI